MGFFFKLMFVLKFSALIIFWKKLREKQKIKLMLLLEVLSLLVMVE